MITTISFTDVEVAKILSDHAAKILGLSGTGKVTIKSDWADQKDTLSRKIVITGAEVSFCGRKNNE